MSFFYLSFCDTNRPKGQMFLGATMVRGADPDDALARATQLGVNPGGEVAFVEFKPEFTEIEQLGPLARRYFEKFVTRDEVLAGPAGEAERLDEDLACATICQDCNPRVSQ
jgi:hypothetical protein